MTELSQLDQQESFETVFEVNGLKKYYDSDAGILSKLRGRSRKVRAVDDVSFNIRKGEILGLAGQSGCGKSTLGELLVQLEKPTEGEILFQGEPVSTFSKADRKEFRRRCQIIFQDPFESLNPRYTVIRTLTEPLIIHGMGDGEERVERAKAALEEAGLSPPEQYLDQLPSQLSGGERQRVSIARALVLEPDILIADEPVSMLDVSVRTGILHLFKELQERRDLSMLYISHDLSTISYLADRTMIMYLGNNVEIGPTNDVIQNPSHPYTEALLKSVPTPDPNDTRVGANFEGSVPDSADIPDGCRFHPKCEYSTEECLETEPALEPKTPGRKAACYHPVHSEDGWES